MMEIMCPFRLVHLSQMSHFSDQNYNNVSIHLSYYDHISSLRTSDLLYVLGFINTLPLDKTSEPPPHFTHLCVSDFFVQKSRKPLCENV